MKFEERCAPSAGNMLLSYTVAEDNEATAMGFTFMGVCKDAKGEEVHVFQKEPHGG